MSKTKYAAATWLCLLLPLAGPGHATLSRLPESSGSLEASVSLNGQRIELSLDDALALGLRNNRQIRSAHLQRTAQKFDLRVAEDAFNPQLTLSASHIRQRGSDDKSQATSLAPTTQLLGAYGTRFSLGWAHDLNRSDMAGRRRSDGLDLAFSQPLARGAGREVTQAPLRMARLSEQVNRLQLQASVAQTVTEIISAYRRLLGSQAALATAQEALERARHLLEVNQALIEAGSMAPFEAVQTEAEIAVQELSVEQARNYVEVDRSSLLALLALDLTSAIVASDTLEATQRQVWADQALRLAQARQPNYQINLLQSRQADLNLLMAKDQARWDVALVGGVNQVRDHSGASSGSGARRWDSYAGVRVEIPIGDLSSRQAKVHAQVAVQTQALADADARQMLERQVIDGVRQLRTGWRQLEIAQRAHELAQRKLEIEHEKLAAGRSSNFQVLSFEMDLRHNENALLAAKLAYLDAQSSLDLTLGTTLDSWEISLDDA